MRINYAPFLFGLLTMMGILLSNNLWSQTLDTIHAINIPLLHEDISLYDFAEVRTETDKSETPPPGITKRNFQPVREIFSNDSLRFDDSVKSAWFKFTIRNDYASDISCTGVSSRHTLSGLV
jgi:hypothetical protein